MNYYVEHIIKFFLTHHHHFFPFFQLMSAIKTGRVAQSRFDQLAEQNAKSNAYSGKMERSGGGV